MNGVTDAVADGGTDGGTVGGDGTIGTIGAG
jgi:hypothetical protein